jgi:hypothetical protein
MKKREIATFCLQLRQLNPYATEEYPNNCTNVKDTTDRRIDTNRRGLGHLVRLYGQSIYERDTVRRRHYCGHQMYNNNNNNNNICGENKACVHITVYMSTLIVCYAVIILT